MVRPAPHSPASAGARGEQNAAPARSVEGGGAALRPSDADSPVSETAALGAAPAASEPRQVSSPLSAAPASAPLVAPAATGGVASVESSKSAVAPQERRAGQGAAAPATVASVGAPTPTPVTVSTLRRRKESPGEFRDRCATDGGLMQGGGKYGLCIIR